MLPGITSDTGHKSQPSRVGPNHRASGRVEGRLRSKDSN